MRREKETGRPSAVGNRGPQLGLVCITHSDEVRYRALTRKRLLQLSEAERERVLRELYADNLSRLDRALSFCEARGLSLYRMTSGLFPFADDEAGAGLLEEFAGRVGEVGGRAARLGVRLVLHPDQFVVLNSDSEQVVANSFKILETHARVMDLLGQPRTPWALIEIHGGKGGRADRLVENVGRLPAAVRSRIAFENDEYTYGADEILEVCRRAGVPMVFDAHHHVVHEKLDSYEHPSVAHFVAAARETWPDPAWQLVHISNGRASFADRNHSDLVEAMPEAFRVVPWIEVEAKHKELAIEKLRSGWLAGSRTAAA
ncbi:MAG TPA: UV DNA damage repair endonuclease UvsE [Pyrinomonadaceae bacterium]|nr:UV DNA damage repair endonuclease UvsE [Pyrinomonadaceae bacterium]